MTRDKIAALCKCANFLAFRHEISEFAAFHPIFATGSVIQYPFYKAYGKVGQLLMMLTKNDVIQGADQLGKNYVTWGQANSTGMPPDQKVNKDA